MGPSAKKGGVGQPGHVGDGQQQVCDLVLVHAHDEAIIEERQSAPDFLVSHLLAHTISVGL
jgi:hypothetical protein